jgi:hypothetical protein
MKMVLLALITATGIHAQSYITGVYDADFTNGSKTTWKWRPSVVIPAFKARLSNKANTDIDFLLSPQIGGGISLSNIEKITDQNNQPATYRKFSWSPATFLITNKSGDNNDLALTYATTVALFDDLIVFGLGYDLGDTEKRWQRPHLLLSFGVSIDQFKAK